jgi:uroporphyrinogen-III decarboxylase
MTALAGEQPDRVPHFLFGMDPKLTKHMVDGDLWAAYALLGIDAFPVRIAYYCQGLPAAASFTMDISDDESRGGGIFAGWNGPDEFGRVWSRGAYVGGDLKTWEDLDKYTPQENWEDRTPSEVLQRVRERYPDKAVGVHVHLGPFGTTLERMGFEHFCLSLFNDRELVAEAIKRQADWILGYFRYVEELGVDYLVMGDDVAYKGATFVSPRDFEELAVPHFKRIVDSVNIPVIWHSDGYIEELVGKAIEIGFKGIHPVEANAGNDMGRIKKRFGNRITLIGNVDALNVLTRNDPTEVRREVDRCMTEAKTGGAYMLATSNSAHFDCRPEAIIEMYRYGAEVGIY